MRQTRTVLPALFLAILHGALGAAPASAQHEGHAALAGDSAAVAAVVEGYHAALAAGDTAAALGLLAPDAVILESGGSESREEYASHHLPADMEFAAAVARERSPLRVVVNGATAWTTATGRAEGEFRGREVRSRTAELMVLRRIPEGWRIAAIHWSSRPIRDD